MNKFLPVLLIIWFTYPAQSQEHLDVLSEYLQYPSIQYNEKPAGMYLLEKCREKGLTVEILTDEDTAFNFVASIYPLDEGKPNIILLNHIDVIGIATTGIWKYPPYSGQIKDDTVWGRGAIDCKGLGVAQLYAISAIKEKYRDQDLPYNISILSVSGEETGGDRGAQLVADHFLKKLNPVLMLGEGGSGVRGVLSSDPGKAVFGISTVEKTRLILKLELELESSGHGSVPPPEYATKEMIIALGNLISANKDFIFTDITSQSLKQLGRHEKGVKGFVLRHNQFFLFKPLIKREMKRDPLLVSMFRNTVTLTEIDLPSTAVNQLSSKISASLDCRLLPGIRQSEFIKTIEENLKEDRIKVTVVNTERSGGRTKIPEQFALIANAIEASYPGSLTMEILFPATTDNHLFRVRGIPVYGIFPAVFTEHQLATIHSTNEYITAEQMNSAIRSFIYFLENMQLTGASADL